MSFTEASIAIPASGARYTLEEMLTLGDVPVCPKCGGRVKPDVVLYEEGLDPLTVSGALDAIRRADLLIVAGTSLTVYPAAGFLNEYPGNRLVLINKTETPRDDIADLALHEAGRRVCQTLKSGLSPPSPPPKFVTHQSLAHAGDFTQFPIR